MTHWTRILMALLALAFAMPCGHSAEHREHSHAHYAASALCAAHPCDCHDCSLAPCTEKTVADTPLPPFPTYPPASRVLFRFVLLSSPRLLAPTPPPAPFGMLAALRTVRLLV